MIEVIPTIIAKDFQELQEKIKKIEPYSEWVQLDIMDGRFVENTTWNNPEELKNLKTNLNIETHLMIQNPEEKIDDWIKSGAKRIIFHYEATENREEVIKKIKEAGLEVGLAINPETPIDGLAPFIQNTRYKIQDTNLVLFLTVRPGRGGQKFIEGVLPKIRDFRRASPDVKIEVDGGINPETAKKAIEAGVDILISGSYIFGKGDIHQAIEELKNL